MDLRSRLGVTQAGNYVLENADSTSKMSTWYINDLKTKVLETDTTLGWLDLKEVFPVLRNLQFLDTSFFKNLKVVVEFNTDVNQILVDTDPGGGETLSTAQPLLIADEILVNVPPFKGVQYVGIEHDRIILPAVTINGQISETVKSAVVSNSFLVNGFNNKTVGRCMISKQSNNSAVYKSGTTNYRGGQQCSIANNQELLQMNINGSSKIPYKGIQYDNQRLAMLNDVWGPCSTKPFHNGSAWLVRNNADDVRSNKTTGGEQQIGMMDYYGININDSVLDMQIDYDRRGIYVYTNTPHDKTTDDAFALNVPENVEQQLNIFCEVYKAIKPTGDGNYQVVYE
jgi:hypothetical protein